MHNNSVTGKRMINNNNDIALSVAQTLLVASVHREGAFGVVDKTLHLRAQEQAKVIFGIVRW
jgi:hypothetical protein